VAGVRRQRGDTPDGHRSAEDALIWRWKNETKPYDDPERRQAAHEVRKTAGLPAEARDVRTAADLMNGRTLVPNRIGTKP